MARVVDFKYELVEDGRPTDYCAGKNCRRHITAESETQGGRRQLKKMWYWAKKRKKHYFKSAIVAVKTEVEAAVLKALTGKAKKRRVYL